MSHAPLPAATSRDPDRARRIKEAIHRYICVSHLHHSAVEGRISRLGFHHSQHRTLMHLARYEHIPSQKELADAMGISPAAATATLKRLEKDGYIARTVTNTDNRRNEIRITDSGRRAVEESRAIFDGIDTAMFADFSDKELDAFTALLDRLQHNLTASDTPPAPPIDREMKGSDLS